MAASWPTFDEVVQAPYGKKISHSLIPPGYKASIPGEGCEVWFSKSIPGRKSPYGIQVDSPDQRQWMSRLSIGSIRRMASIVAGAPGSQRAVKWRSSPTVIFSTPMSGGYVASSGPDTPDLPQTASSDIPTMPTISTHVLDTEAGAPARGVHVSLYKLGEDDRPIRLTQALTDDDGRIRDLLGRPMSTGIYRLEFNLAGTRGPGTGGDRFFRRLTLELRVDDVARSYHVPLLLAPFALTTYRGT